MDYFEELPDHLLLYILDLVSDGDDINTLFRLRTLSHRFNSLAITKTKHLFLHVDKFDKLFNTCFKPCYLHYTTGRIHLYVGSRQKLLFHRCFNHVTKLVIELPALPDSWTKVLPDSEAKGMYKATFGKNLKNCVILSYLNDCHCDRDDMEQKIKAMHFLLDKYASSLKLNVLPHLENLVSLVVKDSGGDLEMAMDKEGIRECRESERYENAWLGMPTTTALYSIRINRIGIDIGGALGRRTVVLAVAVNVDDENFDDMDEEEADNLARRAFGSGVAGIDIEKLLQSEVMAPYDHFFFRILTIKSHF